MDKLKLMGSTAGIMGLASVYAEPVTFTSNDKKSYSIELTHSYSQPIKYVSELDILKKKLTKISELDDNWNGMGAVPIQNSTLYNVELILEALKDKFVKLLDIDDIVPSPYGTISLYFEDNCGNEISVEIGSNEIGLCGELNGEELIVDEIPIYKFDTVVDNYINKLNPLD
ncbi:MAG: hypothetical protein ACWA41_12580 [Putridiphycobacter sp.]